MWYTSKSIYHRFKIHCDDLFKYMSFKIEFICDHLKKSHFLIELVVEPGMNLNQNFIRYIYAQRQYSLINDASQYCNISTGEKIYSHISGHPPPVWALSIITSGGNSSREDCVQPLCTVFHIVLFGAPCIRLGLFIFIFEPRYMEMYIADN